MLATSATFDLVDGNIAIGLDVGGTKVAVARVEDGRVVERLTEPTEKHSSEALTAQMARLALTLTTKKVTAVGAGVPSAVEWSTGRVMASVNVPFDNWPLREKLSELVNLPVAVDNDAKVAALAEAHREDGSVVPNLVMFTIGTGVGGGLVIDGRPYRGATGGAGHLGHEIVSGTPEPPRTATSFPRPDTVEAQAAGPVLDRLAQELAATGNGALSELATAGKTVKGPDVVAAAQSGDAEAIDLLSRFAGRLAPGVANAIHSFDPDEVVIGGGVSAAGDLLLLPLRAHVEPLILPGIGTKTTIRLARHGGDAGVVGAALLALSDAT
ncbi:MAG: ROK family protein [Solirubrobacterales bacterium]|nr:ROK family protein [Solirubrobacterales bacterium]